MPRGRQSYGLKSGGGMQSRTLKGKGGMHGPRARKKSMGKRGHSRIGRMREHNA